MMLIIVELPLNLLVSDYSITIFTIKHIFCNITGEGTLDFNQFLELMARTPNEGDTEDEIDEAFRVFDPSATGNISFISL